MNSRRFPGKVLAPLSGKPVIRHVLDRVAQAIPREAIVVATSASPADDPLAEYVKSIDIAVCRGELENVVGRFQRCLERFPCAWFLRVCADSPLLDPGLLRAAIELSAPGIDLVTNVHERTFPAGQSVECVAAEPFAAFDTRGFSAQECEHLTQHYYRNPGRFRIVNLRAARQEFMAQRYVVDTLEDLTQLESIITAGTIPVFADHILRNHAA